jgi:probable F420-dependent oxidoreductase
MQLGVVFSQAGSGTDPVALRRFATESEAAGYGHFMAYDHVLGASAEVFERPVGRFPGVPYTDKHEFHEILTLFAHLSAVTTTLEFASSVLVLPQRQTAIAAKQIATINLLSGNRMHVSVGVGWNYAEYGALGTAFESRVQRLSEQMTVMRKFWTEPLVTFQGQFHNLDRIGINPCPGKAFPIWMGTSGVDAALKRVARDADGWMPLIIPGLDPVDVGTAVVRLRQFTEDAGRDPASVPVWGRTYLHPGWRADIEQAKELGFSHMSIGYNRMANPDAGLDEHLDTILDAKAEADRLVG